VVTIVPHLWFDDNAGEAVDFYTSLISNSKVVNRYVLEGTPSGSVESFTFDLAGQTFAAISGGPLFTFTPAVSLMILCRDEEEVNFLWNALISEGEVLMPLDTYPFNKYYGWLKDRFGLTWQIAFAEEPFKEKIVPHLLFAHRQSGKGEEAVMYYTSIFPDSEIENMLYYKEGEADNKKAKLMFSGFRLNNQSFNAMDDPMEEEFTFNEALSFMILCKDQKEIDYYWNNLSADPQAEECGWLKDRFGVSWQVLPDNMDDLLSTGTKEQIQRVTEAFLKMKKIDCSILEKVWHEENS
jgi:predicted 3-demethylubiquinone-9 3-methyltransferase (glyoxalase superfamily)